MARRDGARRIGLLGGTFNPVHIGHLRGALEVSELLDLDELRLIPSARPPHREAPQVTAEQRLAMARLAKGGVLYFSNNFRKFQLDPGLAERYAVEEISAQTLDQDFARTPKIHRAWRLAAR